MHQYVTILLTSSIRVTAEEASDLDLIGSNLKAVVSNAYDKGEITAGCHDDTSIDTIVVELEVMSHDESDVLGCPCGEEVPASEADEHIATCDGQPKDED